MGKGPVKAKELTTMALLGAILYIGQICLAFLPNIEVVSILIIVYTLIWQRKALLPIYVFVLLEGVTYGFGLSWIMYLYVWAILYLVVRLARKNDSVLIWAVVNGAYGLSFGALCAIPYLAAGGIGTAFAWWTSGLLFDIFHCVGNFVTALVLFRPLMRILGYIRDHIE
jgi:energy-coupling factor transport system substrate-specific component